MHSRLVRVIRCDRPQSTPSFDSFQINRKVPFSRGYSQKTKGSDEKQVKEQGKSLNHKYSKTLNLPTTEFPMKADGKTRELNILAKVTSDVYEWQKVNNKGDPFVLHDGPPYANGSLHLGHFLNKSLKDFINRYKILRGYNVSFIPGWDCHGLPIELKALKETKNAKEENMSPIQIRQLAEKYAQEAIKDQKASFLRWGVLGEWNNPYVTYDKVYESRQIGVFMKMVEKGVIYRDFKPVHWSPSSRTALAEAELEYPEGHKSQSAFISFQVKSFSKNLEFLAKQFGASEVLIWTTTPWTIPANMAITAGPNIKYSLVKDKSRNRTFILAKDRMQSLEQKFATEFEIIHEFNGTELEGTVCKHPMYDRNSPILVGDHVTTESGTGLVHTAPGHGHDDFVVCKKYKIPVYCPVGDDGRYTSDVNDERLTGANVLGEGNTKVIEILRENNSLLNVEAYEHKYPYDWRTKKPVITRATRQWFARVDTIVSDAINAIQNVEMVPNTGRGRLESMLRERSDWCISRQRVWGVPIPVFYDTKTDEPLLTSKSVEHVQKLVAQHGSECWWSLSVDELLAPEYKNNGTTYRKGFDTMDVWFDSGVSWDSVIRRNNLAYPVDLYLEGSDQHRGWFQSSLLTSIAAEGKAPYKKILTHGFTLDGQGRKMSKSLGNVVDPKVVVEGNGGVGADVLRWWVSSTDYTWDVVMSTVAFEKVRQSYSKVRNTCRFILANLNDYSPSEDDKNNLRSVDKYMLHILSDFSQNVTNDYDAFVFAKVYHRINQYVTSDLSNFYFDITKDRLYANGPSSRDRRAVQYVMSKTLETLTTTLAPILPFLAQDIHTHSKHSKGDNIFFNGWIKAESSWSQETLARDWEYIRTLREQTNILLEKCRQEKSIGSSIEARVFMCIPPKSDLHKSLLRIDDESIQEAFNTSSVEIIYAEPAKAVANIANQKDGHVSIQLSDGEATSVYIAVGSAGGAKCARCWKHYEPADVAGKAVNADLCIRCDSVIETHPGLKQKVGQS